MKESVLDILIYLFENYADPDSPSVIETGQTEIDIGSNSSSARDALRDELELAGFRSTAIDSALAWLDALAANTERSIATPATRAIRVFAESECNKLDTDCRNYILYLENIGILSATQRELVVDRLLALAAPALEQGIDIEQVKWVVLMVLFSQPGQEAAYSRMEDLLFSSRLEALH
jgi:Smg protein